MLNKKSKDVCFVGSSYLLGSVHKMGDVHGSHFSCCIICIFAVLGVLAVFAQFLSFSGNLGVLRAIVSYREPDGLNWL